MYRKTLLEDRLYFSAFVVSLAIHGILLLTLPGLRLLEKVDISEWLEVDLLVSPEIHMPPQLETTASEPVQGGDAGKQAGESPVFPSPPLWLPERMNPVAEEHIPMRLTIPSDHLPDITGPGSTLPGIGIDPEDVEIPADSLKTIGNAPPEIPWKPAQPALASEPDGDGIDMQISGEVANRKVIFRPPLPRPVTPVSGVINLKFWVEPDGTIGKIVPITRTEPELERIAMEYIEKWRFEAVQADVGVQTGTIPIRITIN
jgi:hypothetical protein